MPTDPRDAPRMAKKVERVMKTNRQVRSEHKRLLAFTRLLASYGCAGPPACEDPSVDAATGKREGGLCGVCEAAEWLREHGYGA